MKPPVFLRIYFNNQLQEIMQFKDAQIVIGNGEEALLSLDHNDISPVHTIIEERPDNYYLTDMGSATGTLKNDERVVEAVIESGESFQVGPYKIEFFIGVPKPSLSSTKPPLLKHTKKTPSQPASLLKKEPSKLVVQLDPDTKVDEKPKAEEKPKTETSDSKKSNPPIPKSTGIPIIPDVKPTKYSKATFAPESKIKDINKVIKPGTGTRVEVTVAWQERILSTYYFSRGQEHVRIGSSLSNDIVVPLVGFSKSSFKLLSFADNAKVYLSSEMRGEYNQHGNDLIIADLMMNNAFPKVGEFYEVDLAQNEMIKITFPGDSIQIFVRYAEETSKPIPGPLLDLSFSEFTSILFAVATVAIFGLYMLIYSPEIDDPLKQDEPLRKAVVTFNPPKISRPPPVKQEPKKQPPKKVVAQKKKRATTRPTAVKNVNKKSGKAKPIARTDKKRRRSKIGSRKKGGAVKTGKSGATAKTRKKNLKKFTMLGAFGGGGANSKLDKVFSGGEGVAGLADSATGKSGQRTNRKGSGLGSRLKETGGGAKSTVNIGGVGTKGKGTGSFGKGTGGFGQRKKVSVKLDSAEAEFIGRIDKEAIRRVLKQNSRAFRHCYNMELKKNSNLYGKVILQWTIVEGGEVENAKVASNALGSKKITRCMINKLEGLRFPEPPQNQQATIKYPWVFSTQ